MPPYLLQQYLLNKVVIYFNSFFSRTISLRSCCNFYYQFFLGAGGSGTGEIGFAIGSEGQFVVFSNYCYGFKLDISAEVDVLFGWWDSLKSIPGDTVSYAFGTVYKYYDSKLFVSAFCFADLVYGLFWHSKVRIF